MLRAVALRWRCDADDATSVRTRVTRAVHQRWLPLDEVAPIPAMVVRARAPGHFGTAAAEVAATIAVPVAQPLVSRRDPAERKGRRSAATWRGRTVALLALAMVAAAAAGLVELRAHTRSGQGVEVGVSVPGTGLVVDKPAGWTEGPMEAAPAILTDLVDASEGGRRGLFFTTGGGRALFVIDAPNSAGLDAVPPVPERIGSAVVTAQAPFAHDLGPARQVSARGEPPGAGFGLDADYVLTEGRIVVVGAFAEGTLDADTAAAAQALLASLRSR